MLQVFRRHQKAIFVLLTVMCMGAFSFDILLTRLAPGRRDPAKDVLGHIDGEPVTRAELRGAHQLRLAAGQFLRMLQGEWADPISPSEQVTWDFLILLRRAETAGIIVSDQGVTQYIHALTGPKFGPKEFGQLLTRLQLSERSLYGALKAYLATRLYAQMWRERLPLLSPAAQARSLLTPLEAWAAFRATEEQVRVAMVAVSPGDFADKVKPVTESAVQEQYARHKDRLPGPGPDDYGYRRRVRVRVEYVTADLQHYLQHPDIKIGKGALRRYYDSHRWEFLKSSEEMAAERAAATQATTRPSTTQAGAIQAAATRPASTQGAVASAPAVPGTTTQAATTQAAATQAADTQPSPFKTFDQVRDDIRVRIRREQAIDLIARDLRHVETQFQGERRTMSGWDEWLYALRSRGLEPSLMTALQDLQRAVTAHRPVVANLKALAKRAGLTYGTTPLMTRAEAERRPGICWAQSVSTERQRHEARSFLDLAFDPDLRDPPTLRDHRDRYYLFRRLEYREPGVPALASIRSEVRRDLVLARARPLARGQADRWAQALRTHNGRFDKAMPGQPVVRVGPFGLAYRTKTGVKGYDEGPQRFFLPVRSTRLEKLPLADTHLLEQLVSMRQDEVRVVWDQKQTRFCVARCLGKTSPAWHDFTVAYAALQSSVGLAKTATSDEQWRQRLREDAGLVIGENKQPPVAPLDDAPEPEEDL